MPVHPQNGFQRNASTRCSPVFFQKVSNKPVPIPLLHLLWRPVFLRVFLLLGGHSRMCWEWLVVCVQLPSNIFSNLLVKVQKDEPYSQQQHKINLFFFFLSDRSDFQITINFFRASHVLSTHMLTSASVYAMLLPRYVKVSTDFQKQKSLIQLPQLQLIYTIAKQMNCRGVNNSTK